MSTDDAALSTTSIEREVERLETLLHPPGVAPGDREQQEDLRRRIDYLRRLSDRRG